jgi:hypothetical protein
MNVCLQKGWLATCNALEYRKIFTKRKKRKEPRVWMKMKNVF